MSLHPRNPLSSTAVFAGIVVGIGTASATSLTHTTIATLFPGLPEALRDLNIGIVALVLNVLTLAVVSVITRRVSVEQFRMIGQGHEIPATTGIQATRV